MNTTPEERAEWAKLAAEATPGPWDSTWAPMATGLGEHVIVGHRPRFTPSAGALAVQIGTQDARYIAAMNPQNVARLLADAAKAAELERLAETEGIHPACIRIAETNRELRRELAEARTALEECLHRLGNMWTRCQPDVKRWDELKRKAEAGEPLTDGADRAFALNWLAFKKGREALAGSAATPEGQ